MEKEKLKAGYCLKTKSGDYALVLRVVGNAYVQDAFEGKWSVQSRNENKTTVVYVWNGKFMNKRSLEEIDLLYSEILAPNDIDILEAFEKINKNG